MKQVNTSGVAVHVPSLNLGRLVGPGEEVDYPDLLPGFTATAPAKKKTTVKKTTTPVVEDTVEPTTDETAATGDVKE